MEPSFRYLSPGSEGENCRPLDHMRQIPFIHSDRFNIKKLLYICKTLQVTSSMWYAQASIYDNCACALAETLKLRFKFSSLRKLVGSDFSRSNIKISRVSHGYLHFLNFLFNRGNMVLAKRCRKLRTARLRSAFEISKTYCILLFGKTDIKYSYGTLVVSKIFFLQRPIDLS